MKKYSKLKLAGALLGATLMTSTAAVAAEVKSDASMQQPARVMSDAEMERFADIVVKKLMAEHEKMSSQEHAKAADKKSAVAKWG